MMSVRLRQKLQRPVDALLFQPLLEGGQELVHVGVAVEVEQQPPDDQRRGP